MLQSLLSGLYNLSKWLLSWYFDRVITSWHGEISRLGDRNRWLWVILCIFFTIFLIPHLAKEAFSDSLLLGLSFIWSTFLAVSFGYILRNPLLLIVVYVGVIFSREIISIFTSAKEEVVGGNWIGAAILMLLGVYLIAMANRLKRGEF